LKRDANSRNAIKQGAVLASRGLFVACALANVQCPANSLAVIVNKSNPTESLSVAQLRWLLICEVSRGLRRIIDGRCKGRGGGPEDFQAGLIFGDRRQFPRSSQSFTLFFRN
jgi:hypothetical protein